MSARAVAAMFAPGVNRPQRFPGSDEEREANRGTHAFMDHFMDGDVRCGNCDCRPWGRVAEWPCGATVPREGGGA